MNMKFNVLLTALLAFACSTTDATTAETASVTTVTVVTTEAATTTGLPATASETSQAATVTGASAVEATTTGVSATTSETVTSITTNTATNTEELSVTTSENTASTSIATTTASETNTGVSNTVSTETITTTTDSDHSSITASTYTREPSTETSTNVSVTVTSASPLTQWCIDAKCSTEQHKYCEIINSKPDYTGTWNVSCSCQPGYLPVGSDCVSDDIIIGVSVGVGAAIILGLTIAVICLAVRKPSHSSGKSDTNSSDGKEFVQMEEAHVNKSSPAAEHAPAAAAVISGDVAHVVKVDDGHVTTAAAAAVTAATGSDVKAATGAAVVTAAVVAPRAKLEPQTPPVTAFSPSYAQPEIMTPDYDLAQPMPLNTQYNSNDFAASFVTFAPQLQNVDTSSNFSIKRPTAVTSGSQPGHSSQNPSYKDFF